MKKLITLFREFLEIFKCKMKASHVRVSACEKLLPTQKQEIEDIIKDSGVMLLCSLPNDISKVTFYWSRALAEAEICAYWRPLNADCVFLNSDFKHAITMIIPTIMHELTHRQQFKKFGMLYFILNIPILSQFFLERSAVKIERIAQHCLKLDGLDVGIEGHDILGDKGDKK